MFFFDPGTQLQLFLKFYLWVAPMWNRKSDDLYDSIMGFLAAASLGWVIRKIIFSYAIGEQKRVGILEHFREYRSRIENYKQLKIQNPLDPSIHEEADSQIRFYRSRIAALKRHKDSSEVRKGDIVFGQYFIMSGAILFMLMATKGYFVNRSYETSATMIFFMSCYILAFVEMQRRIGGFLVTQPEALQSSCERFNLAGYYAFVLVLFVVSLLR